MKTILILGSDRIALEALEILQESDSLMIIIDRSTNIRRAARLLWKKRINLLLLFKMLICEFKRSSSNISNSTLNGIESNNDLLTLLRQYKPERVILFRAGLIISKEIILQGIPLLNIHCAKVPDYGGLGSIDRAIKDNALEQNATLHQVTTTIDEGRVLDVEPFRLDTTKSYCHNESVAYQAGLKLLYRTIGYRSPCRD
jgi:methionyl-tRNA formyltransferase